MSKTIDFLGTSGECYRAEQRLAQGGQGAVYRVKAHSDGQLYAVKWYHSNRASDAQRQHLDTLVKHGAPACEASGIEFIWPTEMVRYGESNSYGYVMPLYDAGRYVHYNKVINGKVKQPRRDTLARMSYRVCMALEAVHRSGLAYCDINLGNIQFDVQQGQLIVCDNDNVVINNAEATVVGVAEFMAPEVALGESSPNAQTDLYSIAVLLYQLWMWEHPMEGAQTAKIRCWDQPAKLNRYAKAPIFAHHPTDHSNSAAGDPMLAYSLKRWNELCPSSLQALFIRTFTEGVHNPHRRPRLGEWQKCLLEIEANASQCPQCSAINLLEPDRPDQTCYHCGTPQWARLRLKISYRGGGSNLMVHTHAPLRRHHLEVHASGERALDVLGRVEDHPQYPGAHILRNLTQEAWVYEKGSERLRIEPGKARPLVPEGKIIVENATLHIEAL